MFGFGYIDMDFVGPTFEGAITVDMHYRGGLRGALPTPSLTIDEADVFVGMRFPWQRQRVAEGDLYAFVLTPIIFAFGYAEVTTFADVQAETVVDSRLASPIPLANPGYLNGDRPDTDTDTFLDPAAHVFAKIDSLTVIEPIVCVPFFCFSLPTIRIPVEGPPICLKLEQLEMVPGQPGVDCPHEVRSFAFPPR